MIEQMFGNFPCSLYSILYLCYNSRVKEMYAIWLFCML